MLFASDGSNNTYWDYQFAGFGNAVVSGGQSNLNPSALLFSGMATDIQSDVFHGTYYEATERLYDQNTGRWTTADPSGRAAADSANPQTWNRYAYAGNNPLSYIDPLGLHYYDCYWYGGCNGNMESGGGGGGGSSGYGGGGSTCNLDGQGIGCTNLGGLGSQAYAPCPNNFCSGFSNGSYYQYAAFANGGGGYFAYTGIGAPGTLYYGYQQAGVAAVAYYNPTSISENREYGGNVYQDDNGFYSYDLTNIGAVCSSPTVDCGFVPNPDDIPPGTSLSADWHTHAGNNWWGEGEIFSQDDYDTADTLGIPSFLGTPEGRITMYDPANPFAPLPILAGPPW